jgi:hypothetical protein
LEQLIDYQLIKHDPVPWYYFTCHVTLRLSQILSFG